MEPTALWIKTFIESLAMYGPGLEQLFLRAILSHMVSMEGFQHTILSSNFSCLHWFSHYQSESLTTKCPSVSFDLMRNNQFYFESSPLQIEYLKEATYVHEEQISILRQSCGDLTITSHRIRAEAPGPYPLLTAGDEPWKAKESEILLWSSYGHVTYLIFNG